MADAASNQASAQESSPIPAQRLDVTGLLCPLPVLKARKALTGLQSGEVLEVEATDPAAVIDIPHFCQETGHRLLSQQQKDDRFLFWIACR